MATAFIGFGGNIGDRVAACEAALARLAASEGVRLVAVSDLFRSDPVGIVDQPWFVNGVAWVETTLSPIDLLNRLIEIEAEMGRVRLVKNGPRIIDLDLLLYGDTRLDEATLTLPHPRMLERHFVLVPLVQLISDGRHPVTGEPFAAVLARLPGDGGVRPLRPLPAAVRR